MIFIITNTVNLALGDGLTNVLSTVCVLIDGDTDIPMRNSLDLFLRFNMMFIHIFVYPKYLFYLYFIMIIFIVVLIFTHFV